MNLENLLINTNRAIFLNQGAVPVEYHTQLKHYLGSRESERAILNHPSKQTILIIIVLNVTVENQMHASDVDHRISSMEFPNKVEEQ